MSKRLVSFTVTLSGILCCLIASAYADSPTQSAHYQFGETEIGGSGLTNQASLNYQGAETIGDLAVGNSASGNYQINSGYNTTADPALSFYVDTSGANFGSFSPTQAAVATSTFEVSDYTSYGYVVQIMGNPPTNGSHVITPMSTNNPSMAGVEQFGINLVANTSPVAVGADPNHGQFGVGNAAPNYNTANSYRYVSGETIAIGPKSSGITTYTISYIVNVTSLTPGGIYTSHQTLVCTGTY